MGFAFVAEEIGFRDRGERWRYVVGVISVIADFTEEEVGVVISKFAFLASF